MKALMCEGLHKPIVTVMPDVWVERPTACRTADSGGRA